MHGETAPAELDLQFVLGPVAVREFRQQQLDLVGQLRGTPTLRRVDAPCARNKTLLELTKADPPRHIAGDEFAQLLLDRGRHVPSPTARRNPSAAPTDVQRPRLLGAR